MPWAEVEIGEGAALSFTNCVVSFDGLSTCGVNDTIFSYNHAGRKGGAVVIASGSSPSHVEFHRCTVANTTTGSYIEDDPQGEGGAFAVGEGIWLLIDDCIVSNNFCGKKVRAAEETIMSRNDNRCTVRPSRCSVSEVSVPRILREGLKRQSHDSKHPR